MTMVALTYDGLQAFIDLITLGTMGWLINPFINFWAFLTFGLWFSLLGLGFMKPNKVMTMGGSFLIEFIPFINSLPAWTVGVITLLAIAYAEDVVGSLSPAAAKALGGVLGRLKKDGGSKETEPSKGQDQDSI